MPLPAVVAHSVQQMQVWLKELRDNGDFADTEQALTVLRTVLHQLRDRLTVEEATDLSAQLPVLVRGFFFEGWQPHRVPHKLRSRETFVDATAVALFPHTIPAERAIRDVFALLAHHCDPGQIADVIAQMPGDLKTLWPVEAQTFRRRMA